MRRLSIPIILLTLAMIGVGVSPTPAMSTSGCFQFWDWKVGFASYKHGGAGEEPDEIGWTWMGSYNSVGETGHDWFDGGKAERSHDPCGVH
jgi:hypothetical protein